MPGCFRWEIVSGGVARSGLNHRPGLWQAFGLQAGEQTFAAVSSGGTNVTGDGSCHGGHCTEGF